MRSRVPSPGNGFTGEPARREAGGRSRADQTGNTCDQAAINSDLWSLSAHCNASCSGHAPFCGDGREDSPESCDDGFNDACGTCNASCSGPGTAPICGDGVRCPELEACDDGFTDSCGDCNIDCSAEGTGAVCGDFQICPQYEECDDGNTVATDACTAACQPAQCGDNIVQDGVEQCDDGNYENGDDCLDTCEAATCGDGFVQDGVETCDDAASAYVTVRGKYSAYCGLRTSGRVDCWDEYDDWTLTLDGSFTEVAGSYGYACGIRVDGTASCVCDRNRVYWLGGCDAIEAISPGLYQQVSVGDRGPCLLSVDGRIECLEAGVSPRIPATLPGQYSQVSVGASHVCGILSATGEVICEGRAAYETLYGPLTPPAGAFSDVAAGYCFACGLRANGAIECWDINNKGPVPVPTGSFVEINTSYGGICARDAAGSVICWGHDGYLDGDSGVNNSPAEQFISVARANNSACGVKTDGSLVCWGEFAGSLPISDCAADCGVVGGSCEGIPEGTEESRVRYLEESVPSGSTCTSETQVRACTGGVWGDWSGTYTHMSCTVELASCDGTPSGGSESRVRYLEESVPSGSTCISETQVRACTDGVWSDWSGTYTYVSCTVELASCDGTPSGGEESRVRYLEASVPSGSTCTSETQVRICTDGVWSDWSGTYTYLSCVVESPSVYVCDQHTTLGLGVCHEFSGANAEANRDASCAAGIAGTACPTGALGFCDLGGVGSNPPGYGQWHYASTYIADAAASNSLCTAAGGTWSPP